MIQRLTEAMNFDLLEIRKIHSKTKNHFTKRFDLNIEGIILKAKLDESDYDNLFSNVLVKEYPYVKPEEALTWI